MEKETTINELMEFLAENMVTKKEAEKFATKDDVESLRTEMTAGFRMVREEIKETNEKIDSLDKRTSEDVAAVMKDVFNIKQKLSFNS